MILKILFYVLTILVHSILWMFESMLFTLFLNVFVSKSKKNELLSCVKKWEPRYIILISICAFLVWIAINQIWVYFAGQSIPYLLILFLLVQVIFEYKGQKDKDLSSVIEGYHNSFNSEISTKIRGFVKDATGKQEEEWKLSDKQIEEQFVPTNILLYNLKGIVFGIILLIAYLLLFSKSPSSFI